MCLVTASRSLETCFCRMCLVSSFFLWVSLLTRSQDVSSFCLPPPSCQMFSLITHGQKNSRNEWLWTEPKKRKKILKIVLCCFAKALKKDKQICTCRHHLSPSLELTGNILLGSTIYLITWFLSSLSFYDILNVLFLNCFMSSVGVFTMKLNFSKAKSIAWINFAILLTNKYAITLYWFYQRTGNSLG